MSHGGCGVVVTQSVTTIQTETVDLQVMSQSKRIAQIELLTATVSRKTSEDVRADAG